MALKHVFTDVPANAGCLAPIRFIIPDTTLLAVRAPKPVGGYTETILRVIGVIFGALAKATPDRATAAPFGTINALSLAGKRDDGQSWVMFSFFGGGLGGNPETDGLNHGNNPISMATIPPVEILEAAYPVAVHAMGAEARQRGRRNASRRPRRDLRDRGAGAGRRGCFPAWRAGPLRALRRQWRGTGSAQSLFLADLDWRGPAPAGLEGNGRQNSARPARQAGDAWRRRLGRSVGRDTRRWSPATCA